MVLVSLPMVELVAVAVAEQAKPRTIARWIKITTMKTRRRLKLRAPLVE